MKRRTKRAYRDAMVIRRRYNDALLVARIHYDSAKLYLDAAKGIQYANQAIETAKTFLKHAKTPEEVAHAKLVISEAKRYTRDQSRFGRIINELLDAAKAVGGFFGKAFGKIADKFRLLRDMFKKHQVRLTPEQANAWRKAGYDLDDIPKYINFRPGTSLESFQVGTKGNVNPRFAGMVNVRNLAKS